MRHRRRESVKDLFCGLFAGAALFACSCDKPPDLNPEVVARVGDVPISKAEFLAELERRAANGQAAGALADREKILQDMIRVEIMFARAKAAGTDRDPEMVRQFKRVVASRFEEAEWKKRPGTPKPAPPEIEMFYNARRETFTSPEKIHLAILFIRVPAKAGPEQQQQFQSQAEELRQKAIDQGSAQPTFGLLAQEHSEDQATRYRGGDCGWITRENTKFRWDQAVVDALFALQKPGEISPVIRAADGLYIGKLIERKAAETAPLASVRDRIERELMASEQKRARGEFEKEQRRGLRVEINEMLLKQIQPPRGAAVGTNIPAPASIE